jgi:endonuclease YncB( thermonuclease family)
MRPVVSFVYNAVVLEWHDGDTVKLDVDQGLEGHRQSWFRLYGIDCKELATAEGKRAHAYVTDAWPAGSAVVVRSYKAETVPIGKEKYGRWLAEIWPADADTTISDTLTDASLARPYFGGKKTA